MDEMPVCPGCASDDCIVYREYGRREFGVRWDGESWVESGFGDWESDDDGTFYCFNCGWEGNANEIDPPGDEEEGRVDRELVMAEEW